MKVDADFLTEVQRKGWLIEAVLPDRAVVACPRAGCSLEVALYAGKKVPSPCGTGFSFTELKLEGYDGAREFLRTRRENLALSIKDVEECAGMADGHLAKYEKDNPDRTPQIGIFLEWAQSLGYELVLRPTELPRVTSRRIEHTRDKVESRIKRRKVERERRGPR